MVYVNFSRNSRENATAVHVKGFGEDPGRKMLRDFKAYSGTKFSKCFRSYLISSTAKRGPGLKSQ